MFLQSWVGPHAFENFFRLIAENIVDERVDLIFAIYFSQVTEKIGGQISITHSPLLHIPSFIFTSQSLGKKIVRQSMCQTIVETDIGLEMVVDFWAFDSIENGINMRLPNIRWLEIPKCNEVRGWLSHDSFLEDDHSESARVSKPGALPSMLPPPE